MSPVLRSVLVLSLFFLPMLAAADSTCPPADPSLVAVNGVAYVSLDGHVYEESNGQPGLQQTPGTCTDDNGRDHSWNSDTPVV